VQIFKLLWANKHDGFADLFYESLESAFTADIACCDACYDDFVGRWPGTYLRDTEFQSSGFPLDLFYEHSDLAEVFTAQEFRTNLEKLKCPRCGNSLSENIWPYNFPFDVPDGFEEHVDQIALIAAVTPFLVLTNEFARTVYDEIHRAENSVGSADLPPHFRARVAADAGTPSATELGPPPAAATREGRYNHAGHPVCYMATDPATAFLEIGEPDGGAYIATVRITRPVRVIDFSEGGLKSDVLSALIWSALLSAPMAGHGWDQPTYVFSRFVADCVRSAGLDGIRYPTTRASSGCNLVVFDTTLVSIESIEKRDSQVR